MAVRLEQVVPWGRSLDEYARMFALDEAALSGRRILGVGDGPASFNAEMHARGRRVVSVDPIYVFGAEQIRERVLQVAPDMHRQVVESRDDFVWDYFALPERLIEHRLHAMGTFTRDFEAGKREGRYVPASLPALPFGDGAFDLALCSHLLFLYSQHLSGEFHVEAIREMCRVAGEVRIFPLLQLGNTLSPHVAPVTERLKGEGYAVEVRKVGYEFQRGGNEMMVVRAAGH